MSKKILNGLNLRVYIEDEASMTLNRKFDETSEDAVVLISEILRTYKKLSKDKNFNKLSSYEKLLRICLDKKYEISKRELKTFEKLSKIKPLVKKTEKNYTKAYFSYSDINCENLEFVIRLFKKEKDIKIDFYPGVCRIEPKEIYDKENNLFEESNFNLFQELTLDDYKKFKKGIVEGFIYFKTKDNDIYEITNFM